MIDKNVTSFKQLAEITGYSYSTIKNYMSKGIPQVAEEKILKILKEV